MNNRRITIYSLLVLIFLTGAVMAYKQVFACRLTTGDGATGAVLAVPRLDICVIILDLDEVGKTADENISRADLIVGRDVNPQLSPRDARILQQVAPCLSRLAGRLNSFSTPQPEKQQWHPQQIF